MTPRRVPTMMPATALAVSLPFCFICSRKTKRINGYVTEPRCGTGVVVGVALLHFITAVSEHPLCTRDTLPAELAQHNFLLYLVHLSSQAPYEYCKYINNRMFNHWLLLEVDFLLGNEYIPRPSSANGKKRCWALFSVSDILAREMSLTLFLFLPLIGK